MARKRKVGGKKRDNLLVATNIPNLCENQPVYAKIAGYCPWPAKVTRIFGGWCDVFFFGTDKRYSHIAHIPSVFCSISTPHIHLFRFPVNAEE